MFGPHRVQCCRNWTVLVAFNCLFHPTFVLQEIMNLFRTETESFGFLFASRRQTESWLKRTRPNRLSRLMCVCEHPPTTSEVVVSGDHLCAGKLPALLPVTCVCWRRLFSLIASNRSQSLPAQFDFSGR